MHTNTSPVSVRRWSLLWRCVAMLLTLQIFLAPQMANAQGILAIFEECGTAVPPVLEEEVLKHACEVRIGMLPENLSTTVQLFLHWYQDSMLDHPALEVPHQPPKVC